MEVKVVLVTALLILSIAYGKYSKLYSSQHM